MGAFEQNLVTLIEGERIERERGGMDYRYCC